jgi:NitT/TauT family transport system substrate-binding protein
MLHAPGKTSWLQSAILASALLAVACAPAAQPSPTAAPAKPAESKPAATTAAAKPTEAPSAKPAEVKPAASPAAAAKPAEAKPAASPAAKAEAKPAASPAAKAEPKAGLKRVTLRLDWVFQGPNAGFMIARDKGYYEQAGLDVTIGPGQGSGATAQAIANKTDMIGFSDGYVVGNTVSKGAELTMLASIYRRNPNGVLVLDESPIKTPKDLEGKSVGIPSGASQFQQWPAFAKGCNVDASKVNVVNLEPAALATALIPGRVDAVAGFIQGIAPGTEIRGGKKTRALWYADCGVQAISNGIIVHNDLLKSDPEMLRAFVTASLRGFLYGRQNIDELAATVKKFSEATDPAISKREAELSFQTWVTPNTAGKPLGWMADQDWESTVQVLKEYGGVTTPLDAKKLYTNEFVPTGQEFIPPQS